MPLIVAFGLAVIAAPLLAVGGRKAGLVDRPAEGLKIHREPVSVLGGVAVAAGALGGQALLYGVPPLGILGAVAVLLAAGLADDLRPLVWWARLALQALAGILLVVAGLGLSPFGPLAEVGMVVLVVLCANAVNIVDGLDGLAGGLAAVASLGLASLAAITGAPGGAIAGLALAGALVGFLVWNRPPARIFLGNGGAYAVGVLLAVIAARVIGSGGWQAVLASAACLAVFAFELVLTTVRRLRAGVPLTLGDRGHSYDVVARALGDPTRTTGLYWGIGILSAGLGIAGGLSPIGVVAATALLVGGSAAAASWVWVRQR